MEPSAYGTETNLQQERSSGTTRIKTKPYHPKIQKYDCDFLTAAKCGFYLQKRLLLENDFVFFVIEVRFDIV